MVRRAASRCGDPGRPGCRLAQFSVARARDLAWAAARRALATLALFQPLDWRRLGGDESDRDDDRSGDHWSTTASVEHDRGCGSIARELLGERSGGVRRNTRESRNWRE